MSVEKIFLNVQKRKGKGEEREGITCLAAALQLHVLVEGRAK